MEIRSIKDGVEILGYANVPEKRSKPLKDRRGSFVETISEGAFQRSLDVSPVPLLLNHDKTKVLASGTDLEIKEDNIGLRVRALIKDNTVIRALKESKASGFSFGFYVNEQEYTPMDNGVELRTVKDLVLTEVSLLIGKIPAYNNTSVVEVRDDGTEDLIEYRSVNVTIGDIEETGKDAKELRDDNSEIKSQLERYKLFLEIEKLK